LVVCDPATRRQLSDPAPGATAPPLVTTTEAPPPTEEPPGLGTDPSSSGLVMGSDVIAPGEEIPTRYTCDGDDVSPPLAWVGVPRSEERRVGKEWSARW